MCVAIATQIQQIVYISSTNGSRGGACPLSLNQDTLLGNFFGLAVTISSYFEFFQIICIKLVL